MKETVNSFTKRLLSFSIGPIAGIFIGFITVPVTTWFIIPEEFGKAAMFTLAYSMVSVTVLLGIDVAFMREYNVVKDKVKLFWNSITIPLLISVIFSIILLFNERIISQLLFDSSQKFVIRVLAISLPFSVLVRFNTLVIRMQGKGKIYSLLSITKQLSRFLFIIVLVLLFERTFVYIVFAQVASIIVQSFITGYYIRDYLIKPSRLEWWIFKPMLIFGLPFLPTAMIEWIFNGFDKVALRNWAGFNEIGLYSAGFKIVSLMAIIKTSFNSFWIPTIYKWQEEGVRKERFQKVNDIITALLFVLGAFVVLFRNLIFWVLDNDYRNAAMFVPFLIFIPILNTIKGTTSMGIQFSRKTIMVLPIYVLATISNVFGNWILVPRYGALGAAIATSFSFIVIFWLYTTISRRLWRIKLSFTNMTLNIIVFFAFAFITLFNNTFFELLFVIIIIAINYKSFIYLNNKFPLKRIKEIFYKKTKNTI